MQTSVDETREQGKRRLNRSWAHQPWCRQEPPSHVVLVLVAGVIVIVIVIGIVVCRISLESAEFE